MDDVDPGVGLDKGQIFLGIGERAGLFSPRVVEQQRGAGGSSRVVEQQRAPRWGRDVEQ